MRLFFKQTHYLLHSLVFTVFLLPEPWPLLSSRGQQCLEHSHLIPCACGQTGSLNSESPFSDSLVAMIFRAQQAQCSRAQCGLFSVRSWWLWLHFLTWLSLLWVGGVRAAVRDCSHSAGRSCQGWQCSKTFSAKKHWNSVPSWDRNQPSQSARGPTPGELNWLGPPPFIKLALN